MGCGHQGGLSVFRQPRFKTSKGDAGSSCAPDDQRRLNAGHNLGALVSFFGQEPLERRQVRRDAHL